MRPSLRTPFGKALLLWRWTLLLTVFSSALFAFLHPLFAFGLHLVPFRLLGRIKQSANLGVAGLVNIHHLRVPILLRKRTILSQVFHLGVFGLKDRLDFCLLVRSKFEFFRQFPTTLGGIGRTMMPATIVSTH